MAERQRQLLAPRRDQAASELPPTVRDAYHIIRAAVASLTSSDMQLLQPHLITLGPDALRTRNVGRRPLLLSERDPNENKCQHQLD